MTTNNTVASQISRTKEMEIASFPGSSSFSSLEVYGKAGEGLATFLT